VILVLADSADPWTTLVHRELQCRGEENLFWIHPAQLLDRVLLNWPVVSGASNVPGSLVVDGRAVQLSDLTGILARLTFPPPLTLDDLSPQDRDYVIKETNAVWIAFLNALPCAVVNRPIPGGRPTILAGSLRTSRLAQEHGFLLPSSLCTSSRNDAIDQFSVWGQRAYVKPLGSCEPGMLLQADDGVEQLSRIMEQQAIALQSIPRGQRITVYVAGDDAVATVLHPNDHSADSTDLPALPTQTCLDFVRALGLAFAECQFVVTPEGLTYCLDVSGAPSYWHCPQEIQRQIVCRLADYLSETRSLSLHDSLDGPDGRSCARERLCETRSQER
jgi:hypothetical protein